MKEYGSLLAYFKKLEYHGDKYVYFERDEVSVIALCGYSVSKQKNLSLTQRQALLVSLVKADIVSKSEVINHLDMLIQTNGRRPRNREACEKWKEDLNFVREFEINKQKKVSIDKIQTSKNIIPDNSSN